MAIEKIKILGAVLELPAKQHCQENGPNGLNQHCCLAGSSKMAPRILIFSIVLGDEYSYSPPSPFPPFPCSFLPFPPFFFPPSLSPNLFFPFPVSLITPFTLSHFPPLPYDPINLFLFSNTEIPDTDKN